MKEFRVGVLASGRGTDFQSIVDAIEKGDLDATIAVLICNNKDAPVIERAKRHEIPWQHIDHRGKSRREFEEELVGVLKEREVDLVVFAGFMRLVTSHFIEHFRDRIINIHPSLLPSFPGTHAQRDALEWGVRVSGCTVHIVDESADGGPIVFQKAVPVQPEDSPENLADRILREEHKVLPHVIRLFAEGRVKVVGRRVFIDEEGREALRPV
ncbi:MAG: phosphoribosylglycinamide formyltransferase [Candidatus Thermoplasmatota archaeon]|nr:phosphoribosylglycinamide formyltransferase [Candidatus Thermoplasmatota archaeon]